MDLGILSQGQVTSTVPELVVHLQTTTRTLRSIDLTCINPLYMVDPQRRQNIPYFVLLNAVLIKVSGIVREHDTLRQEMEVKTILSIDFHFLSKSNYMRSGDHESHEARTPHMP
ncbi:hypothetical protein TNCV_4541261 [Trichonephila clavipes]|nr:hypothetical protein TNCV_4541261 [Trichonephila clavipes]